jgi:hypothetical protein
MIAFARPAQEENKWYVVIAQEVDNHYRWDAGAQENFGVYEELAQRHNYKIVAKVDGLTDSQMNLITGCNEKMEEVGEKHLENLVRKLNAGARINPEGTLKRLHEMARRMS